MQQATMRINEDRVPMELLNVAPPLWTGPHVGRRLTEAMQTLRELPMGNGGGSSCWPSYCYEWEDLLAQQAQGELERTQQLQNRIRLLPKSARDQRNGNRHRLASRISRPASRAAARRQRGRARPFARPR